MDIITEEEFVSLLSEIRSKKENFIDDPETKKEAEKLFEYLTKDPQATQMMLLCVVDPIIKVPSTIGAFFTWGFVLGRMWQSRKGFDDLIGEVE